MHVDIILSMARMASDLHWLSSSCVWKQRYKESSVVSLVVSWLPRDHRYWNTVVPFCDAHLIE